jgi:2-polyprenyl-3-methyl-5-hydroxy-6-metoxy-1,4-benzoquinol methylase
MSDLRYQSSDIWNTIWSRPYTNYEKHHTVFWSKIRSIATGLILDLGCGSASVWKGFDGNITGIDFSSSAIEEARKNCPDGRFFIESIPTSLFNGQPFDTVILCGVVNYYRDLSGIIAMLQHIGAKGTKIIITINVIKDFPDREWTSEYVDATFEVLGIVEKEFIPHIGWFLVIIRA